MSGEKLIFELISYQIEVDLTNLVDYISILNNTT